MAEISPFQGIRYNQEIIKDMASAICPPYDIISLEEQQQYYQRSIYNIIRLEHGQINPDDNKTENKYTRSRETLNQWLKDDVLKVDTTPTFYIYEQGFTIRGTLKKRLGLIACVRLEPWARKVILPHEGTATGVKIDRLELMRACGSNVSPILGLFDDPGGKITKLMTDRMLPGKLLININGGDEIHRVWKANEPEFTQRVSYFMIPKSIYIADGHHRYETALAYQEEKRKSSSSQSDMEAYNYILMTLVAFSDPGLVMLPVHRLIKGLTSENVMELKTKLADFFGMIATPLKNAELSETRGSEIRILGLEPDAVITLKLKQPSLINEFIPPQHSDMYRRLDVSLLEHIILEKIMKMTEIGNGIAYSPDAVSAQNMIDNGSFQIAFLLNTLPVTIIKSLADAGDRMPRKSTYFYPKLPTGLVINRLQGKM